MRTLLVCVAFCLVPTLIDAQTFDRVYRLSEGAVLAGHALDSASSQRCIGEGRCHELNHALARFNDPVAFTAAKLTGAGLQLWACRKLRESGHPRLALATNVAIGSGFTALAVRNQRIGR